MKKLLLLLSLFAVFSVSPAASAPKADSTFTFQDFVPTSPDAVRPISRITSVGDSRVAYPVFAGSSKVAKNMNRHMEKFIKDFKSTKNNVYKATYTITGNNKYFVSVLFTVEKINRETKESTTYNDAISFNAKDGKPLSMKDIFVQNYENGLNSVVNDRIRQFGITTLDEKKRKFRGVTKKQKFYMEDDAIIFIFNQDEATDFADGQLFLPFMLRDLIGIIK